MHCSVGFLDPQIFSTTIVQFKSKDVIAAIKKAMKHDYVVGAYNTGSHWALVIIAMKWNVVWYLDSSKSFPLRKFKDIVTIHMEPKMKKISKTKPKLTHKTDTLVRASTFFMQCAQQPSGRTSCGFYVASNMYDLLGDINIIKKASKQIFTCILNNCIMQDYKASKHADQGALRMVQGMLCYFILKEIIHPKGNFYDGPADAV
ncbi:hypothetical protein PVAP13_8NG211901 [Panicum virgatum]|uniref:Ubiquitin-like protease family profile domain-containing protein n=1 Tax=Panicum virgatum TaxID=38727 RepID=A0A8T0P5K1_PANVG|nr:hypothetical protein PVAP13_8NG211901 [Panicum virgatum]